jgi:hypothetical protein
MMDDPYKRILIATLKDNEANLSLGKWLKENNSDMMFSHVQVFRKKG